MNKAKYEAMSDAQKKVIDDNSGMALAKLAGQLWDGFEAPARALAEKAGGEFHELSGAELDEMKAAGATLVDAWIEKANGDGLDGAALVETARSLVAKYAD